MVPFSISPVPPTLPVAKIGLAVAVRAPSIRIGLIDKRLVFEVDVNTFHVIDADANESISGARAKREDYIRVTGELVASAGRELTSLPL